MEVNKYTLNIQLEEFISGYFKDGVFILQRQDYEREFFSPALCFCEAGPGPEGLISWIMHGAYSQLVFLRGKGLIKHRHQIIKECQI